MNLKPNLNLNLNDLSRQFQQTSGRDPWLWPLIPRLVLFAFITVAVVVLLWFLWLKNVQAELDSARAQQQSIQSEFSKNYRKAVNLDSLRRQREQAIQYVTLLEKQLPSRAEMAELLSDINMAGIGRGLQFDLFKPGSTQIKDYYAELPIEVQVTGSFDAIGEFVSDLAHLPRIVTLSNIQIESSNKNAGESGNLLTMKAIAKTYRYLDPDELANQASSQRAPQKKR